jgi:hypothetical protein
MPSKRSKEADRTQRKTAVTGRVDEKPSPTNDRMIRAYPNTFGTYKATGREGMISYYGLEVLWVGVKLN